MTAAVEYALDIDVIDAASIRNPVMANSLETMTTTIHASICRSSTNAMKAEQTRILSASGSIKIPKFVMSLRERIAAWRERRKPSLMSGEQA